MIFYEAEKYFRYSVYEEYMNKADELCSHSGATENLSRILLKNLEEAGYGFSGKKRVIVKIASRYHDIGKLIDAKDHPEKGVEWMKKHKEAIMKMIHDEIDVDNNHTAKKMFKTICKIIKHHKKIGKLKSDYKYALLGHVVYVADKIAKLYKSSDVEFRKKAYKKAEKKIKWLYDQGRIKHAELRVFMEVLKKAREDGLELEND